MCKKLLLFLQELLLQGKMHEIIVLTEILVFEEELFKYQIDNCNCFSNSNSGYRTGGVIVYIKKE